METLEQYLRMLGLIVAELSKFVVIVAAGWGFLLFAAVGTVTPEALWTTVYWQVWATPVFVLTATVLLVSIISAFSSES